MLNLRDCDNSKEDHNHLFFQCHLSKQCLQQLKEWLQIRIATYDLSQLIRRILGGNRSKFQKQTILASIALLVYLVWHNRNLVYWEHVPSISIVVKQVTSLIKDRIYVVLSKKITVRDHAWF